MTQNFEMTSGDTHTLTVTVRDKRTGAAVNLTDASVKWALARDNKSAPLASKSTSSGITITDAANGVFQVTISPADTADIHGEFYHEAQVTDSSGRVVTVLAGRARIKPDIIE